jgi:phosphatidylglycerophosphatase C
MENKPPKVIAAFDFDGTITTKDTLFHFISYCFGNWKFGLGLLQFSPTFIKYLIGISSNHEAKERLFQLFFRGMEFSKFQELGNNYQIEISQILNNEAINKINWHKSQGHHLIIISASIENWISPWAKTYGFELVIGTQVEVNDGKLTGHFSTKNCHGTEKVSRLLAEFPNRSEYKLYAYGDSSGDKELLKEADFAFYRKF